jgi:hypothetical protein
MSPRSPKEALLGLALGAAIIVALLVVQSLGAH